MQKDAAFHLFSTFVCLTAGALEELCSMERFHGLSDLVRSAVVE